jgi:hypothetical protein
MVNDRSISRYTSRPSQSCSITCTADVSETDETGIFEAIIEVTAVPVG